MSSIPPPPPRFAFSLTPSTGNADAPLDLNNRFGQSIHDKITEPFTTKFDGEPDNCLGFIEQLLERVTEAGWDQTTIPILQIPIGPPTAPSVVNLIEEHGRVTMVDIRSLALTYANTQTRAAQNSYHMFQALI